MEQMTQKEFDTLVHSLRTRQAEKRIARQSEKTQILQSINELQDELHRTFSQLAIKKQQLREHHIACMEQDLRFREERQALIDSIEIVESQNHFSYVDIDEG